MRTMPAKTYVDLKKEVWESGKCSGCGGCVAVCPADAITFPEQGDNKAPVQSGTVNRRQTGYRAGHVTRSAQGLPDRRPRPSAPISILFQQSPGQIFRDARAVAR